MEDKKEFEKRLRDTIESLVNFNGSNAAEVIERLGLYATPEAVSLVLKICNKAFMEWLMNSVEIEIVGWFGSTYEPPSLNYAGFQWVPVSEDRKFWRGPVEHLNWIQGRLGSGGFVTEIVKKESDAQ
jgi:hypothetical protein